MEEDEKQKKFLIHALETLPFLCTHNCLEAKSSSSNSFIFISSGFLSHWNSSFPHLHYNDFLAKISPFKYSKLSQGRCCTIDLMYLIYSFNLDLSYTCLAKQQ